MIRFLFVVLCLFGSLRVVAAAPKVVASIAPVHSIAAFIMQGVGEPALLLTGSASPHDATLKPSQARLLQSADLVFWIGDDLETFLAKPIVALSTNSRSIAMMDAKGIHFPKEKEEGDDDHSHGHGHEKNHDPHIWLSPENAVIIAKAIADALVKADGGHADNYEKNFAAFASNMKGLNATLIEMLKGLSDAPFLTFHDGFGHFEDTYGLTKGEALTINPEIKPGAKALSKLRQKFANTGLACVFSEPQFDPKNLQLVSEGLGSSSAILDPLGSSQTPGPDLYRDMMLALGKSFKDCLSAK